MLERFRPWRLFVLSCFRFSPKLSEVGLLPVGPLTTPLELVRGGIAVGDWSDWAMLIETRVETELMDELVDRGAERSVQDVREGMTG
jgi:hypothetical protein